MGRPTALSEVSEFEFIFPENEKDPPEEQVKFRLTGLSGRERAQVRQALLGASERRTDGRTVSDLAGNMEACELAVALGLKGWVGMKRLNAAKQEVDVPWPGSGRAACDLLRDPQIQRLALEIMRASELTGDEAKN